MTDVGATAAPTGPIARGSVARVGAATALAVACVYTVIYLAARDLPPGLFFDIRGVLGGRSALPPAPPTASCKKRPARSAGCAPPK